MKDEPGRVDIATPDIAASNRDALSDLFPGVLADGVFDASRLAELLNAEMTTPSHGRERFGLQWAGKHEAVRSLLTPSQGTLEPLFDQSIGFDTGQNVFIEGDNLETLKLLQKSYNDVVKLIYIDPPYNTGHDFVYNDDFSDGLRSYLEYSGQLDDDGNRLSAAADTSGRQHSHWLSMIYPRLILARNLLRQDGACVVSIDDNEVHHLRVLLDEVFGAENHVADIIWQKKYTRSNDARYFSDNHEYLLVYARNIDELDLKGERRPAEMNKAYTNPDEDPRGPWKSTPLHAKSGRAQSFQHTFSNGVVWSPPVGTFPRFTHERLAELEASGAIWFGKKGDAQPSRKTYLADLDDRVTPTTLWTHDEVGSTHEGNNELKALDLAGVFNNPKPTKLIRKVLELFTGGTDVVLDFFAGSGTTAHAVALQNESDGGQRRCISVNLPEPVSEGSAAETAGLLSVSAITLKRIHTMMRAVPGAAEMGLRVFRLAPSHFRDDDAGSTSPLFDLAESTLKSGTPDMDAVAVEALLKEGVRLDQPIERSEGLVSSGGVAVVHALELDDQLVDGALQGSNRVVVFLEDAFANRDILKVNAFSRAREVGVMMKTI